jgi:hypothetical protein
MSKSINEDAAPSPETPGAPDEGKPVAADMQTFIGRQLRAVYDDIARQPVPDRFLELMKQLESKTADG